MSRSWDVRTDLVKNRLYVRLVGRDFVKEGDVIEKAIENALARVKPGFDVVNDLRDIGTVDQKHTEQVARIQGKIAARGVRRVVRVTPKAIARLQFQRTGGDAFREKVFHANEVEEADRMLDDLAEQERAATS